MNNIFILPQDNNINVSMISVFFSNVTNSYKFFWFLSILDEIYNADQEKFIKTLSKTIQPMIQMAANLGFNENWIYNNNLKII